MSYGSGPVSVASAVSAITFIGAHGEPVTLTRDDPDFLGSVISLGALGVYLDTYLPSA